MQILIILISAIALVTVAASVAYLSFVSAKYNGWRDLAEVYRWRGPFPGQKVLFQSASLNEYSFPGTWVLGVSESGIFLKLVFLRYLFHPPLMIPWQKLRQEKFSNRFGSGVKLTIPEERFELELSEQTRSRLADLVDDDWGAANEILGK